MHICKCGEPIAKKRAELNYQTCLECGEQAANRISTVRRKSIMPLHKSSHVYVGFGDITTIKLRIKEMTGKNGT